MSVEFALPTLGEGITEGEILTWHVEPGETVAEDDVLAEVETDKAAVDVPSPVDGTIRELHYDVGDVVNVGELIVTIAEEDHEIDSEKLDSSDGPTPGSGGGRAFASPTVRRLARERDVDIATVSGSGPSGRITDEDVREATVRTDADDVEKETHLTSAVSRVSDDDGPGGESTPAVKSAVKRVEDDGDAHTQERTTGTSAQRGMARDPTDDIESISTDEKPTRREPYRGVRRTIGEQKTRSRREIPHAVHHDVADVSALVDARERLTPLAEERGVRLTHLPFVLKSVVAALREHPILNTELDEEAAELVYKQYYDVGLATATDSGLPVSVVENVDEKGILEVAAEITDLVEHAADRSIERSAGQNGTFTVRDVGAIGGEFVDPVIDDPGTGTLAIGELTERAVVRDGDVVAASTLPLSLAIDTRVVDGAEAARFVDTIEKYLADPTLLLLE